MSPSVYWRDATKYPYVPVTGTFCVVTSVAFQLKAMFDVLLAQVGKIADALVQPADLEGVLALPVRVPGHVQRRG